LAPIRSSNQGEDEQMSLLRRLSNVLIILADLVKGGAPACGVLRLRFKRGVAGAILVWRAVDQAENARK
jgi:hypothetical protein